VTSRGRVFLLDDDELIVSMLARALKSEGYEVRAETDPSDVVDKIRKFGPDAVLLDIKMPGANGIDILKELVDKGIARQVIMLTSDDTAETAVKAMKSGAADYLTKPFDLDEVKIVVKNVIEKAELRLEVDYLRRISAGLTEREIIGSSATIAGLKQQATKLGKAGVPTILITGESGTGKEMFARYTHGVMHGRDQRKYAPFVGVNCTTLPETLIESELFGHEKGSFTDAKTEKKGLFELAHRGSILLDEIAEMNPALQSKLLRVLEERQIRRIGGKRDITVDVTVFATTNKVLSQAVEAGDFRVDLFYRLNAFSLHVPPLRDRREDIPVLARHFLQDYAGRYGRTTPGEFSPQAEKLLRAYEWPGNVRELRNVVERIVVLESVETVLPEHLPKEILRPDAAAAQATGHGFSLPDGGLSLEELEKDLIAQALAKAGGNKTLAAKLLNVTYDTLRYQVKKFGLE
jgi:DNA-binding NtrC family response regulator